MATSVMVVYIRRWKQSLSWTYRLSYRFVIRICNLSTPFQKRESKVRFLNQLVSLLKQPNFQRCDMNRSHQASQSNRNLIKLNILVQEQKGCPREDSKVYIHKPPCRSMSGQRLPKEQGNAHKKTKQHSACTDTTFAPRSLFFQPTIIMAACECMKEEAEKTIQCFLQRFPFPPAQKYFAEYPGKVLHRFLVHSSRGQSFNREV